MTGTGTRMEDTIATGRVMRMRPASVESREWHQSGAGATSTARSARVCHHPPSRRRDRQQHAADPRGDQPRHRGADQWPAVGSGLRAIGLNREGNLAPAAAAEGRRRPSRREQPSAPLVTEAARRPGAGSRAEVSRARPHRRRGRQRRRQHQRQRPARRARSAAAPARSPVTASAIASASAMTAPCQTKCSSTQPTPSTIVMIQLLRFRRAARAACAAPRGVARFMPTARASTRLVADPSNT